MSWLTDKRFLIGAAVGFFVGPYVAKTAKGLLDKMRSGAGA